MPILSDYLLGYENGYRDGQTFQKEKAKHTHKEAQKDLQALRVLRVELANTIADPMWDAHAEVSKRALKRWHEVVDTYIKENP